MAASQPETTARTIQAGLLAWLVPGAGHYFLGYRNFALVFFLAISVPFWAGLAIGGVVNSVNPGKNPWLFLAELGIGGYTAPNVFVTWSIENRLLQELRLPAIPDQRSSPVEYDRWARARARYVAYYPESDVAQIYLATAGLLNLLAILDAISRAQTGGQPTFHHEAEGDAAAAAGAGQGPEPAP